MDQWTSMRAQFPVCQQWVYLNHAAVAPLPLRCKEMIEGHVNELVFFGAANFPKKVPEILSQARTQGAKLLGTDPDQVFFVRSTTQGLGIVATGLPLGPGDNLVLVEREFPANLRPWLPLRKRGVELRLVPQRQGRVWLQDLAQAVDARTQALSVSFVQFLSGFRIDLEAVSRLCKKHDALLVVDAIQGLGGFPLEVEAQGIDFLSADSHKWLLGPHGVGLGYASTRALERIQPALEGWLGVESPFAFFDLDQPLKSTAARYEEGAYNLAGLYGMSGSLELILNIGVDKLSQRILALTDYLVEGLASRGWSILSPRQHPGEKSGIVLCQKQGVNLEDLPERLKTEGIVISIRAGGLRISPHGYNTTDELDRLLEVLD